MSGLARPGSARFFVLAAFFASGCVHHSRYPSAWEPLRPSAVSSSDNCPDISGTYHNAGSDSEDWTDPRHTVHAHMRLGIPLSGQRPQAQFVIGTEGSEVIKVVQT